MENISHKFYLFLLNKSHPFIKKEKIQKYYNEFVKLWNIPNSFDNIFQTLKQQKKIIFIFDKQWKILQEEEWFKLKTNKIEKLDILISYLDYNKINWYFGLSSAKYFSKETWQSLNKLYIINDSFQKNIKIDNLNIKLLKIPSKYIIDKSININKNKKYSDYEKTFLDEIYFYLKKKYTIIKYSNEKINFNTLNLYLKVFEKNKEIKIWILNNIDKEYLKNIK